jgi:DNA replication protein DnaC
VGVETSENFTYECPPVPHLDAIAHLPTTAFVARRENVVLLGPPGVGRAHHAIAVGTGAADARLPIEFDSATASLIRLGKAHTHSHLDHELHRLNHCRLLIIGQFGCLPFETPAAALFLRLIASLSETNSAIVAFNLPFSRWRDPRRRHVAAHTARTSSRDREGDARHLAGWVRPLGSGGSRVDKSHWPG